MKRCLLFNIFTFCILLGYTQKHEVFLLHQRDSLLQLYNYHQDTISLNTWLNVMQSNKYLKLIVGIDSLLITDNNDENLDSLLMAHKDRFKYYESSINSKNQEIAQLKSEIEFNRNMNFMLLLIALIFLVVIIVLLFLTKRLNGAIKSKENDLKTLESDLDVAKEELEKSRTTENQLASDFNKLKKLMDENDDVNAENEVLKEEKMLLENQIVEIKKAYELESSKRMELELEMVNNETAGTKTNDNDLNQELQHFKEQNKHLQANLDKTLKTIEALNITNKELQDEMMLNVEARKVAEKNHQELVNQLKKLSRDL